MQTERRKLLHALPLLAGLALTGEAAEAKPLTSDAIARNLLAQADKARFQGMPKTAATLRKAAVELLQFDELGKLACTTDADCERKNPRLAARKGVQ